MIHLKALGRVVGNLSDDGRFLEVRRADTRVARIDLVLSAKYGRPVLVKSHDPRLRAQAGAMAAEQIFGRRRVPRLGTCYQLFIAGVSHGRGLHDSPEPTRGPDPPSARPAARRAARDRALRRGMCLGRNAIGGSTTVLGSRRPDADARAGR